MVKGQLVQSHVACGARRSVRALSRLCLCMVIATHCTFKLFMVVSVTKVCPLESMHGFSQTASRLGLYPRRKLLYRKSGTWQASSLRHDGSL